MAFIEGGAFRCDGHGFETSNIEDWNEHCSAYPNIHYEVGETLCMTCHQKVYFDKLPYQPIDPKTGSKNISLRCEECESKMMGSVVRRSSSIKQVKDEDLV